MIVGNVSEYIERCLRSFAPIADEIVLVRAIGAQQADETMRIANIVCDDLGIPLIAGDYRNKPEHQDWPHVDDFSAARQMSFDLATSEYCFWCDSDDVLMPGSAEIIRQLAERGGYPVFIFPYEIFGRGVNVPRERMIIRESGGKWKFPVHECFQFPMAVNGYQDDRVVVRHLPHGTKSGSNTRNLRILESIPESERTAGIWYHLHGELVGCGRKEEAMQAAAKALKHPDIGTPEKYELFLNMARMTENYGPRMHALHQAYATDPKRREALGLLTCTAMDFGKKEDALAFARQMAATQKPDGESWNDRSAAYEWLGVDIYTQALRMNGKFAEAEKIRVQSLMESGGPTIALLHATRGRPWQASVCKKRWLDLAEHPERIEHVFVIDEDDEESKPLLRMHSLQISPGGGCVAAWNHAAMATVAPIMVQLSDDWVPAAGWDTEIMRRIGDPNKPAVLAISDGNRKDDLLCMAICTRAYWSQDYFLFHPDFTGVYSDNWFTREAYRRGHVIDAKDLVFAHSHPAFGTAEVDATYAAQNAPERYAQGQAVMAELEKGSDWSSVPGFFNYWPFYESVADKLKDGDEVAEIGCWLGRSLIHLAQRCKRQGKRVKFYAVDTFHGESNQREHEATVKECGGSLRASFEANLIRCGVRDMVEIIEGDSAESASKIKDGSLAFCFIDAAHDYESVKRDVAAWKSKIADGGILAGHDAQHDPVWQAVSEQLPNAERLGVLWLNK